jgi:cell division protein FtsB
MLLAREKEKDEEGQIHMFRDNLRERVAVLEAKLEEASEREKDLLGEIRTLATTVAALKVEIEYLRKENIDLKTKEEE